MGFYGNDVHAEVTCKRIVVMIGSVILLVLAILSLSVESPSTLRTVLSAIVIAASVLGFLGAAFRNTMALRVFEYVCWALFVYGVIVIIVRLAVNEDSVRDVTWDIVQTAMLAIVAGCAHDLAHTIFLSLGGVAAGGVVDKQGPVNVNVVQPQQPGAFVQPVQQVPLQSVAVQSY
jgi:hypothetical protein